MNGVIVGLSALFGIVEAVLGIMVGYLLLLTVAALFARRKSGRNRQPQHRFALLIPAHNEERLLPDTLASLTKLDYPSSLYDVFVVADNCTDRTADIARQIGAIVYEREHKTLIGKGHALNWLMDCIQSRQAETSDNRYGAFIILDADTIVSSAFLSVMDARLSAGDRIIQGYYAVRDPDRAWSVALRYAALAVLHYLRPLGRSVLGGTSGLKGNGMCLIADVARRFRWSGSLTEDIEYHSELVLAGERVAFAPDAVIEAEMPGTLQGAYTQNTRWEQGRLQMLRTYFFRQLWAAIAQRRFAPLDAAMEQIIPPTSVLIAAIVLCIAAGLGAGLLGGVWWNAWTGVALLTGTGVYLIIGLWLAHAPIRVWLSLLYAPVFMVWKLWLYLRILAGRGQQSWVRTQRQV